MPESTVIARMQMICSECGEDVYTCDECGDYFDEGDDIYCYENENSEGMLHRHKECGG